MALAKKAAPRNYALFNKNTFNFRAGGFVTREAARISKQNMPKPRNWRIAKLSKTGTVIGWVR